MDEFPEDTPDHLELDEELLNADSIDYISKSRIQLWQKCPRKFYYKYILGLRQKSTEAMERGSELHEIFEKFYENAVEYVNENGTVPEDLYGLLPDDVDYDKYIDPYISNFISREEMRRDYADDPEIWKPIEIEEYAERSDFDLDTRLMGYPDVIVDARTIPTVFTDEGVVIIDFKTGDTPDERYRDEGIFLEGEFYAMLFEEHYNISAVAGYYPKENDLLISKRSVSREKLIKNATEKILEKGEEEQEYPAVEQPLCAWGEGEHERCPYYDEYCESTWANPIDNKDLFTSLVEEGVGDDEISDRLNTSKNAVRYWKRKLDLV